MLIEPGGPESSDDPPTPPTPFSATGELPALEPFKDLGASTPEKSPTPGPTRERSPTLLPPGTHEPGDPPTAPTARDGALRLAAPDLLVDEDTPRTHRGARPTATAQGGADGDVPSLDALRRSASEAAPKPIGVWARIKAMFGL